MDDGFLTGVKSRLSKNSNIDVMPAGRLFLFHEALHYSSDGYRLTMEVANGIGRHHKIGTYFLEITKTKFMATTSRGRSQDRKKVAGGQDYEVQYEAKKTNSSSAAVKKAVKAAGNSRGKVEDKLKKK